MSEVWETKDGRRRIRRDPPTLEEAVVAAQGLTDDFKGQVEIVASLMEVSVDEARGAVLRMGQRKGVNHVTVTEPCRRPARRCGGAPHAALCRGAAAIDRPLSPRQDAGRP